MVMNIKDIEDLIKRKLPDSKVIIKDVVGDNNHFSAEIVSKDFMDTIKFIKSIKYTSFQSIYFKV